MKRFYLLFIIMIVVLSQGCKDSAEKQEADPSLKVLNGKIQNYDLGENAVLRLEIVYRYTPYGKVDSMIVIDSAAIKSDGSFSVVLSKPPDVLLHPRNGLGCAGLEFRNDAVRTYPQTSFIIYKNNKRTGYIYCSNMPYGSYSVGKYWGYLMYSEDLLKVTGDCRGSSGNRINSDKMNLNFEKGWNFLVKTSKVYTDSISVTESVVDNNFNGNWIYGSE